MFIGLLPYKITLLSSNKNYFSSFAFAFAQVLCLKSASAGFFYFIIADGYINFNTFLNCISHCVILWTFKFCNVEFFELFLWNITRNANHSQFAKQKYFVEEVVFIGCFTKCFLVSNVFSKYLQNR